MPDLTTLTEDEILDCLDNDADNAATLKVGSAKGLLIAKGICHSEVVGNGVAGAALPNVAIHLDPSLDRNEWVIVGCSDKDSDG